MYPMNFFCTFQSLQIETDQTDIKYTKMFLSLNMVMFAVMTSVSLMKSQCHTEGMLQYGSRFGINASLISQ